MWFEKVRLDEACYAASATLRIRLSTTSSPWAPRDSNPARRIKRTQALSAVLAGITAGRWRAKSAKFWAQFLKGPLY
jgi:hypothetical protein